MAYIYDLTDTWNAGGTTFNAIKMNVTDSASAAGSKLVTLQTNGTEHFSVTKAGVGYFSGNVGIGTASPSSKLTVLNGDIEVNATGLGNTTLSYNGTTANLTVNSSSASLVLGTSSTERMRITSAGNVGIGTSSPSRKFSVQSGDLVISEFINTTTSAYLDIADGIPNTMRLGSFGGVIGIAETATTIPTMAFVGGNVGLGTTGPQAYSNYRGITVEASTGAFLQLRNTGLTATLETAATPSESYVKTIGSQALWFGTNNTERMRIDSSGNVGIGTSSPAQKLSVNGNIVTTGEIALSGADFIYSWAGGTTGQRRAGFYLDGTNQVVRFYTAQNEVARIDSSGNLLVGTTSAPGAGNMRIASNGSSASIQLERTGTSAGTGYIGADVNNCLNVYDGSLVQRFYVTQAGACYNSTGTYGTISDAKLKENIQDAPNFLDDLGLVRVVKYSLKSEGLSEADKIGVIAQELEEVFPEMIEEFLDVDGTGEKIKAVKYSVFIPVLVKAIQELTARVAQLEGN